MLGGRGLSDLLLGAHVLDLQLFGVISCRRVVLEVGQHPVTQRQKGPAGVLVWRVNSACHWQCWLGTVHSCMRRCALSLLRTRMLSPLVVVRPLQGPRYTIEAERRSVGFPHAATWYVVMMVLSLLRRGRCHVPFPLSSSVNSRDVVQAADGAAARFVDISFARVDQCLFARFVCLLVCYCCGH